MHTGTLMYLKDDSQSILPSYLEISLFISYLQQQRKNAVEDTIILRDKLHAFTPYVKF